MSAAGPVTGIVGGAFLAAVLLVPATDRIPPIEITVAEVMTPVVQPGGNLVVRFTVDRRQVCPTTATVTIFDGAGYEYRLAPDSRPAFGPQTLETKLLRYQIPTSALPGDARYRLVLDFQCNWTHNIVPVTMILPDLGFEIGEPTDGP